MRKKVALTATAVVSMVGLIVAWAQAVVRVLRVLFPDVIWDTGDIYCWRGSAGSAPSQ